MDDSVPLSKITCQQGYSTKSNRLAAYHYFRQKTANLDLEQLVYSPYPCVALLDKSTVGVDGNVAF